jgi:adenylate cyclase
MDFTVIGDSVNLGSRMEGATKAYGVQILCTESTVELAARDTFLFREVDKVVVKGKSNGIKIFEVRGRLTDAVASRELAFIAEYEKALLLYRSRKWTEAAEIWQRLADSGDACSGIMLSRMQETDMVPPLNFDGVHHLTAK